MSNRQVSERPAKLAWFFSTKGRAGVTRFMAVTFAMVFVIGLVAWGFANLDAATYPLLGALGGAALAKLFAEAGRRCHDQGRDPIVGAVVLVGILIAAFCILSLLVAGAMAIGIGAIGALAFAVTFFRPGQPDANSHGEPPLGPLHASRPTGVRVDRRGLAWAGVSILGCAAIGLAIQTTTDHIRADRESRQASATGSLAMVRMMDG